MLLIRRGKKMSDDWIYDIVPKEQIDSINRNADKTISNMSGGVTIMLGADNQSAIDLCQYWQQALSGDATAWIRISSFMAGIIETIEEHLFEEGINPYDK
jgi:tyrosyl-tRNA synthetase